MPAITRVVLFGSLVHGTPSPRSDADLIVIVRTSPHAHGRDRIPEMLAALAPLPCPIDLFVLTEAEVESGLAARSPLLREALGHGLDLLESRM